MTTKHVSNDREWVIVLFNSTVNTWFSVRYSVSYTSKQVRLRHGLCFLNIALFHVSTRVCMIRKQTIQLYSTPSSMGWVGVQ